MINRSYDMYKFVTDVRGYVLFHINEKFIIASCSDHYMKYLKF